MVATNGSSSEQPSVEGRPPDPRELPEAARSRLAQSGGKGGAWTSDLSVDELAAIVHAGFKPVGLVMGSSVYHIGSPSTSGFGASMAGMSSIQRTAGGYYEIYPCPHGYSMVGGDHYSGINQENPAFEQGMVQARNLAMGRLVEEAKGLGAHGVVGVELSFHPMADTRAVVEFTAFGTAVTRPGGPALPFPFTSNLSGQDFWKLIMRGFIPSGLVMGVAAVQAYAGCGTDYRMGSWTNVEVTQYTDAVQTCRELAIQRLEAEAARMGDGVIGTTVGFSSHEFGERMRMVEMTALGTAVRRFNDAPLPAPPLPIMALRDR